VQRLTTLSSWFDLHQIKNSQLYELRTQDRGAQQSFVLQQCGVRLNFVSQFLTENMRKCLFNLAKESRAEEKREALFKGEKLNFSENRPALHTALRAPFEKNIMDIGEKKATDIQQTFSKMCVVATKIRQGKKLGFSGKPIKNIINIGIGGSDLGPKMSLDALRALADQSLNYFFISDADPLSFEQTY
jgi:glucose-6-phosphate isomerase